MNHLSIRGIGTVLLLNLTLFVFAGLKAQESTNQLVITEVYLDQNQPAKSWVEFYNPSEKALVLARFRLSHIRTINVLPKVVQDAGGIEVKPGECLVLCADKALFSSVYGHQVPCTVVEALKQFAKGGFIAAATKGAGESRAGIVRYGDPEKSVRMESLAGSQVVPLVAKGPESYSRKVEKTGSGVVFSAFAPGAPTPGVSSN